LNLIMILKKNLCTAHGSSLSEMHGFVTVILLLGNSW